MFYYYRQLTSQHSDVTPAAAAFVGVSMKGVSLVRITCLGLHVDCDVTSAIAFIRRFASMTDRLTTTDSSSSIAFAGGCMKGVSLVAIIPACLAYMSIVTRHNIQQH